MEYSILLFHEVLTKNLRWNSQKKEKDIATKI